MYHIAPNPSYLLGLTKYISFVDEAGHAKDPNHHYLCLTGLLATESAWTPFETEWRESCETAGLTKPFHMMDLTARRREFKGWPEDKRRELLGQLVAAIVRAQAIPIGSVVSLDGYRALPAEDRKTLAT